MPQPSESEKLATTPYHVPNPAPNPSLWYFDIEDMALMTSYNWGLNATNLAAWAPN
jgi:hypothetical protein